jgi:hypothetical protein
MDITPPTFIDSGSVTMTGPTSFNDGDIQDELITVMNVIHPGTYTGDLILLIPGQKENDALNVALKLSISITPNVTAPTVSMKVVHKQIALDNGLISWLIPDSADNNNWIILLTNQGPLPVAAMMPSVVLTGDRTGTILTNDQIKIPDSTLLPPHQTIPVKLTITPDVLPPDHYNGTILYQYDGFDTTLSVNMELNVRYGPFWPLIVILLGIVLGRLAVNMKTWFAQKQLDLLPEYYHLNDKIVELSSHVDEIIDESVIENLTTDLQHIHERIESSDVADTEDSVTQDIKQLEGRVQFFIDLRNLEEKIQTNADFTAEQKEDLMNLIVPARDLELEDGKDKEALAAYNTALGSLSKEKQALWASRRSNLIASPPSEKVGSTPYKTSQGFAHVLAFLSGSRVPVAELRYWVARPLLALLLLVLLVLIGLQTLYVNSAMFGAAGVFDYLALLL